MDPEPTTFAIRRQLPIKASSCFKPSLTPLVEGLRHIGLLQRGYLLEDGSLVRRTIDQMLREDRDFLGALISTRTPLDGSDFLRRAAQIVGHSWPIQAGPLVRRDGQVICLDFAAATARFEAGRVFPRVNGEIPNARAAHFETAVQRIVDSTDWRPSDDLACMRGRTLRRDGQKITDLDAVGARGSTLLVIS
ncbi:MAG TPA: hypothetical protein VK550_08070 [Polyangiaceae bacterium]|nr:hypothetical protein [Polyangiaceae bacterium]